MKSAFSSRAAAPAVILACAAALRAAYSFLPLPSGDGGSYLAVAYKLLGGGYFFAGGAETFELLYRTPGYPLFLAAVLGLTGHSLRALIVVQHFIGILSALLIYRIGLRVWGRPAALLAALFAGLHFHFAYSEAYPLSEALAVFLLAASVYLVLELKADSRAGMPAFALAGLTLAMGGLCRPEIAGLAPLSAVYFWSGSSAPARLKLRRTAVFLLPALMLLGAWTLRNGLLFDYWGLTPNAQIAFFDGPAGMCARAGEGDGDMVGAQALLHRYDYGRVNRAVGVLEDYGINYQWSGKRIGALALAAAVKHPAQYFRLSLGQLRAAMLTGSTWPPQDLTETIPDIMKQPAAPAGALRAIGRVDGWLEGALLAPLFLAGCLLALALWKKDALFLAAGAGYLLAVYSFLSPLGPRYRIVAEPLMGLLAAGAACFVWSRFVRSRERTEEVPPAPGWLSGSRPLIALAAAACCWCWFMTDLALAYKARSLSFSPEAAPLLRAAAGTPPDKAALAGLGYLALDRAMYPAALKYFERALALDSGSKAAGDGRAAALFRMGRGGEALAELKRGEALHGPSPDLAYNIALVQYLSGNAPEALKHLSLFLAHPDIPLPMRDRALALKEELLGRT